MTFPSLLLAISALLPAVLMAAAITGPMGAAKSHAASSDSAAAMRAAATVWRRFRWLASVATGCAALSLIMQLSMPADAARQVPLVAFSLPGAWITLLVQLLGLAIGVFSSRYLQGEAGQARYAAALSGVLAAVHLLLLADHWLVLIGAWAAVGLVLQRLLCFYGDRPFALLAAHKKQVADRLADVLLIAAASISWIELGSGSLSLLWAHLASTPASTALQASAVCLVLAVLLRTAVLPMHGWLIQVMEAPTPVSALLHAGVVNLGGFVLIRFAPLLEAAPLARWLLVIGGLATAVLAGLVMLTRISIKVRLAWSTVAQMGFMVMECGLGLYTLALLHLLGHSLYKAHAFLMASRVVEETRRGEMHRAAAPSLGSMVVAPVLSGALIAAVVGLVSALLQTPAWPWWWCAVLALAWAPLLWLPGPGQRGDGTWMPGLIRGGLSGAAMVLTLCAAALMGHLVPLGVHDAPNAAAGGLALLGMALFYACLVMMQSPAETLARWRRRSYAGFYIDEYVTRATLQWWPTRWTRVASP
jgi:NAD(P)H-quinone oxidoreductase subunit 5